MTNPRLQPAIERVSLVANAVPSTLGQFLAAESVNEIAELFCAFVRTALDSRATIHIGETDASPRGIKSRDATTRDSVLRSLPTSEIKTVERLSLGPLESNQIALIGWQRKTALTEDERRWLGLIAEQAGAAIHRLELTARAGQSERRAGALQVLYETIGDITSHLDLDQVLDEIVKRTRKLFNADTSYISLIDHPTGTTYVSATAGIMTEEHKRSRCKLGHGLGGLALLHNHAEFTSDYLADTRAITPVDTGILREGIRAMMCAPLVIGSKQLGLLFIANRFTADFTPDEVALLTSLAHSAAIAIERAQLYEEQKQNLHRLKEAHELVESQHRALQRALAIHNQLTHLVLEGSGISEIAVKLGQLIHSSIAVEDQFHNIRCAFDQDSQPLTDAWSSAQIITNHAFDPRIQPHWQSLVRKRLPVYFPALPDLKLDKPRVIAPIVTGRQILAYLTVIEDGPSLADQDLVTIEYAATVFALEIVKEKAALEFSLRLKDDLLVNLLDGSYGSDSSILTRAAYFGYNLATPHHVAVFNLDEFERIAERHRHNEDRIIDWQEHFFALIDSAVNRHLPGSAVARRNTNAIVLAAVPMANLDNSLDYLLPKCSLIQQEIKRWLPEYSVSVGVGRLCSSLPDYQPSYWEARQALQISNALRQTHAVVPFERLGLYHFLLEAMDKEHLRAFSENALRTLADYDEKYHTDLLPTLRVLFAHNFNLRQSSDALFIHFNTLRHRFERIKEISNLDLDNAEVRLQLHLALKIQDLFQGNVS